MDTGLLDLGLPIQELNNEDNLHEIEELASLRSKYFSFLNNVNPLKTFLEKLYSEHDKVILFPLQVDDYFMISSPLCGEKKQYDILLELLKSIPKNYALIVTNYKTKDLSSNVITDLNYSYLKEKFPNLYFTEKVNNLPSCSQFIAPFVDGIITISSSLGYQAAFWKKPLLTIGKSQISLYSTADNVDTFISQLASSQNFDRDRIIISHIKHRHVPLRFLSTEKFSYWLEEYIKAGKFSAWTENTVAHELSAENREINLLYQINYFNSGRDVISNDHIKELSAQIVKHDVISFDIFDTLLNRPFWSPADLYDYIASQVKDITGINSIDFRSERVLAERLAFQRAVERNEGEVTIKEIYEVFSSNLNISEMIADKVMELEMETEMRLLAPRPTALKAFLEAKELKKRIIIISDMYLPEEFLHAVLEKNGYSGYEKLFISSKYKAKKHNGKLFDIVLDYLQIDPTKILHVGDNIRGDVQKAKERKIKPFHLIKAKDAFTLSTAYKDVWERDKLSHSLDWRTVLSVIANKLNDNPYLPERKGTLFGGDAKKLGYYGLGPLLLGYIQWVLETAQKDSIEHLFFLSRDGKIMKEAYDIIAQIYPNAPKSSYLLCSRRAVNLARAEKASDFINLVNIDYAHNVRLGHLLTYRFGLNYSEDIEEILQSEGFSWQYRLTADDRPKLRKVIETLTPPLQEIAEEERKNYIEYLDQEGFKQGRKIAIVDIGYAGTMQESLSQLSKIENLSGYYLITFRSALKRSKDFNLPMKGFLADFIDRHDTFHPFCHHVPLYETLISASETSFIRMARNLDNSLFPVFLDETVSDTNRAKLTRVIQYGATEFISHMVDRFGTHLTKLDIEPNKSLRVLNHFFKLPIHVMQDYLQV